MRACAILAALVAGSVAVAADEKPAIKEITFTKAKASVGKGDSAEKPKTFSSAKEVEEDVRLKDDAEEIKKQVDFTKEKLVVFWWGGSGGDKLTPDLKTEDKKTTAQFLYTRGLTRDFRLHMRGFTVPKDAEVKSATAK
jgi:hypothetical protein